MKAKEYVVAYGKRVLQHRSDPMTLRDAIATQGDIERLNPDCVSAIRPRSGPIHPRRGQRPAVASAAAPA